MANIESYRNKTFSVSDPDARVRQPGNLLAYETYRQGDPIPAGKSVGDFKIIARNTRVRIDQVELLPSGSESVTIFVHARSTSGDAIGWTSSRNLKGAFETETLGAVPPEPGAGRFGPNAAWAAGSYLRQVTLVKVVSVDRSDPIRYIAEDTCDAFLAMVDAAATDGVSIGLTSGFRTYAKQKYLYDGFVAGRPGFNKAAPPGSSPHQNGVAFDLSVPGGNGNPTYEWLKRHATAHGFLRTVSGEPWHWEHKPAAAAAARGAGRFAAPGVT